MPTFLSLGPFDLLTPIAQGGYGRVWSARHRKTGAVAAIKTLWGERARDPAFVNAFQQEVRAVASLDHPAIVTVYDSGIVPECAANDEGGLVAGTPWLAMEYASGGSLAQTPNLPWSELRALLLLALDALGHAHAHGVIHRDLKLGNLLVCNWHDRRPGIKLSDFGIAAHDRESSRQGDFETPIGTLRYMAPEQLIGRWRDHGAWTDLYGLGVMAWGIATQQPAFPGMRGQALIRYKLLNAQPELPEFEQAPPGFAQWLHGMLAREPERRFPSAPAAARALLDLPPWTDERPAALASFLDIVDLAQDVGSRTPNGRVPRDWRPRPSTVPPARFSDCGIALHGLRPVPVIGRESLQDRIWRDARRVAAAGTRRLIELSGTRGVGASTLATWLRRRMVELGAGRAWHVTLGPGDAPGTGVERLARAATRSAGCNDAELHTRLLTLAKRTHQAIDPIRMAGLCRGDAMEAGERHQLLARLVQAVAEDALVVLHVDDLVRDPDLVAAIETLLLAPGSPVLVVSTATDEDRVENPASVAAIEHIIRAGLGSEVRVPALGTPALIQLGGALGLDEALSAQLAESCGGSAGLMVRTVDAWVAAGKLHASTGGFVATDDALLVPLDERTYWKRRIDQLLTGLPEAAYGVLASAVALGDEVRRDDWSAVVTAAVGAEATSLIGPVEHALTAARLVEGVGTEIHFIDAAFRERLWSGVSRLVHRAVATVLSAREGDPGPGHAARLGQHWSEAEEYALAVPWLVTGARERLARIGPQSALRLARMAERALAHAEIAHQDPRQAQVPLVLAEVLAATGDDAGASQAVRTARELCAEHRWSDLLAHALMLEAEISERQGESQRALVATQEVVALIPRLAPPDQARALRSLGSHYAALGDVHLARRFFESALHAWAQLGQASEVSITCLQAARLELAAGNTTEANLAFHRALTDAPNRGHIVAALTGLGAVCRKRGDGPLAERWFRRALKEARELSRAAQVEPHIELGLLSTDQTRWAEARAHLERAIELLESQRRAKPSARARLMLLPTLAAQRDWHAWERHLRPAVAILRRTAMSDPQIVEIATHAGQLAASVGEPSRALQAFDVALEQARSQGDLFATLRIEALCRAIAARPQYADNREDGCPTPSSSTPV